MLRSASAAAPASMRIGAWSALAVVEFIATRLFVPLPDVWNQWPVIGVAHAIPKTFFLSLAIFSVLAWPRRAVIFVEFNRCSTGELRTSATAALSATAVLLAILLRAHLSAASPGEGDVLACLYAGAVSVGFFTLMLVATPLSFWRSVMKFRGTELISALAFGAIGIAVGEIMNHARGDLLSETHWAELSDATLNLSFLILKVFESSAFMDLNTRVLGAGDFSVRIFAACSGYEGMMLISTFLVGYMLVFRQSLRFPNILILFPLAMAAIWLLNGLRISLLVYIGANVSPQVALDGFHSQFGWISFLFVAIAIMTFAQRSAFLGANVRSRGDLSAPRWTGGRRVHNPVTIYLAPFIALMAGQIMTQLAAPHDYLLYPVKVLAVGAVLFALRDVYKSIWSSPAFSSILLGAVAGILWIASDPAAETQSSLGVSLSELSPVALAAWLAFRAIGTILMVPIAEELAFRGYLYRVILSSRFERVDFSAFSVVALAISSILFGLMHDRWLAASLAGLLYTLIMVRRGRIADAIVAHMTTNAVIFAWAVGMGQWSLL